MFVNGRVQNGLTGFLLYTKLRAVMMNLFCSLCVNCETWFWEETCSQEKKFWEWRKCEAILPSSCVSPRSIICNWKVYTFRIAGILLLNGDGRGIFGFFSLRTIL